MQKNQAPCPVCKRGFLLWYENGEIRCTQCGFKIPEDNQKPTAKEGD